MKTYQVKMPQTNCFDQYLTIKKYSVDYCSHVLNFFSFKKLILIIFAKIAFVEETIFKGTYFAISANVTFLKVINKLFHLHDSVLLM